MTVIGALRLFASSARRVLTNAAGSRDVWGDRCGEKTGNLGKPIEGLPSHLLIGNDKGRYRQDSVTGAPRTFQRIEDRRLGLSQFRDG